MVGKTILWTPDSDPDAPSRWGDNVAGRPFDVDVMSDELFHDSRLTYNVFRVARDVAPRNRYRIATRDVDAALSYLSISGVPHNVMIGARLFARDGATRNAAKIAALLAIPARERYLAIEAIDDGDACPAFDGFVNTSVYMPDYARPHAGDTIEMTRTVIRKIHWVSIVGTAEAIETAVMQCAETATPLMVEGVSRGGQVTAIAPTYHNGVGVGGIPLAMRIRQWPESYGVPGVTPRSFDYASPLANDVLYVCDCGNTDTGRPGGYSPCSLGCGRTMYQAWPFDGRRPARLGPAPFSLVTLPGGTSGERYDVQKIGDGGMTVAPLDGGEEMERVTSRPVCCGVEMEREDRRWFCGKCGKASTRDDD